MLENRFVDAATAAVISVVDDDRRGRRPIGPEQGGHYSLEGAVAAELYKHLDSTFERDLRQAINAAREEETGMRLGFIDVRELADDVDADLRVARAAIDRIPGRDRLAVAAAHDLFAELNDRIRAAGAAGVSAGRVRVK